MILCRQALLDQNLLSFAPCPFCKPCLFICKKQAEAEVVPSSSLVEVDVGPEVEVVVEVEVEVGGVSVGEQLFSIMWAFLFQQRWK